MSVTAAPDFQVDQVWRTRDGELRQVRRLNNGEKFPIVTAPVNPRPSRWQTFYCYTLTGSYFGADGKPSPEDLVELVSAPNIRSPAWMQHAETPPLITSTTGRIICLASTPELAAGIVHMHTKFTTVADALRDLLTQVESGKAEIVTGRAIEALRLVDSN